MDIDYKAIGLRVKIARVRKAITQEKLAEAVDMSTPHISNIETGGTKLSLPAIINIANALNATVDELLCDNITKSRAEFEQEAKAIFSDLNDLELKITVDVLKTAKELLRKYKINE